MFMGLLLSDYILFRTHKCHFSSTHIRLLPYLVTFQKYFEIRQNQNVDQKQLVVLLSAVRSFWKCIFQIISTAVFGRKFAYNDWDLDDVWRKLTWIIAEFRTVYRLQHFCGLFELRLPRDFVAVDNWCDGVYKFCTADRQLFVSVPLINLIYQ